MEAGHEQAAPRVWLEGGAARGKVGVGVLIIPSLSLDGGQRDRVVPPKFLTTITTAGV